MPSRISNGGVDSAARKLSERAEKNEGSLSHHVDKNSKGEVGENRRSILGTNVAFFSR